MAELCETEPSEGYSAGNAPGGIPKEEVGASIFDHGSRMGIIPEESQDYWVRDLTTATWKRLIVVPRREFYHPSEGSADSSTPMLCPDLYILRDTMLTMPSVGKSMKDDWRTTAMESGPCVEESIGPG